MPGARAIASGASAGSAFGPIGSVLGGLAGPILGGLFGKSGQSDANRMNRLIARENREFQERMSNTAYQRAAKDLDAAGLNRILAIGSPSSTPAGNIATMQNENAELAKGITAGSAQALTARRMNAEIKNINARTELTNAQRRALGGAAEVGGGLEEIIVKSKERLGNLDWRSMGQQTSRDATTAKDAIGKIAESVNLNPFKARRELIKVVEEMDLPPMTDAQKYRWAMKNPDKIKSYLERKKRK